MAFNPNPNKFLTDRFSLSFSKEPYIELNSYIRGVQIPKFTAGQAGPFHHQNSHIPLPGNDFQKGDLVVEFALDENWRSFGLIWNWLAALKDPDAPGWNIWVRDDIVLSLLDSTQTTTVAEFRAVDAWPDFTPEIYMFHGENSSDESTFMVPFVCTQLLFELKQELADIVFYKDQE